MKYTFTWETRGVYIRFFGEITIDDILEAKAEFHGNEGFEKQEYSVWDFSKSDPLTNKSDKFPLLIAYHLGASFTLPFHQLALVTQNNKIKSFCDRFITEIKENGSSWDICLFNSETEAMDWCNSYN